MTDLWKRYVKECRFQTQIKHKIKVEKSFPKMVNNSLCSSTIQYSIRKHLISFHQNRIITLLLSNDKIK